MGNKLSRPRLKPLEYPKEIDATFAVGRKATLKMRAEAKAKIREEYAEYRQEYMERWHGNY